MKIYKPNLKTFLQEAKSVIYLQTIVKTSNDFRNHYMVVTGFNSLNQVLEYNFSFAYYMRISTEEAKAAYKKAEKLESAIIKEIGAAGFAVLPGMISTELVEGEPFIEKGVAA